MHRKRRSVLDSSRWSHDLVRLNCSHWSSLEFKLPSGRACSKAPCTSAVFPETHRCQRICRHGHFTNSTCRDDPCLARLTLSVTYFIAGLWPLTQFSLPPSIHKLLSFFCCEIFVLLARAAIWSQNCGTYLRVLSLTFSPHPVIRPGHVHPREAESCHLLHSFWTFWEGGTSTAELARAHWGIKGAVAANFGVIQHRSGPGQVVRWATGTWRW